MAIGVVLVMIAPSTIAPMVDSTISTPSSAMMENTTTGVSPQRLALPGIVIVVVMAMASPSRKTAMAASRLPEEASLVIAIYISFYLFKTAGSVLVLR